MASQATSVHLRHLNNSAYELALNSPAVSRSCMTERNSLMSENNIEQTEAQKREVCGACGTIMILGWTATLEFEYTKIRQRKAGSDEKVFKAESSKTMVYSCGSCGSKTRQRLNPPTIPARRRKRTTKATSLESAPRSVTSSAVPSTNASSKKRAKSRKAGSLNAILAKHKAAESGNSGFGLDLMDLMKKP